MFWNFRKKPETTDTTPSRTSTNEIAAALPLTYLKKLIPVGTLANDELSALPITLAHFTPGQIIFNRGDYSDTLTYLYSGEVFLESASGHGQLIEPDVFKACYPLSTQNVHPFTAIAKTQVAIARMPLTLLASGNRATLANNPLVNSRDVPPELANSSIFAGFTEAYRHDDMQIPSLPDVAIRLRQALQKDIGVPDAVKIVNLDPVIAAKLIQVTNSPIYRAVKPISSSHDAILRLGFKTTQNLVTSISMRNLFRTRSKELGARVQQLWKQSIYIASLSHTLASLTGRINPDEAMLAGLVQNIGALPIITYAEKLNTGQYSSRDLDATIDLLQNRLGSHILKKWNFPENLQQIPMIASHWYGDDGSPQITLSDIVVLARFHSLLGTSKAAELPPLGTLPAFRKLGDNALTPDMSLQALHDAKQQINDALSFFRA